MIRKKFLEELPQELAKARRFPWCVLRRVNVRLHTKLTILNMLNRMRLDCVVEDTPQEWAKLQAALHQKEEEALKLFSIGADTYDKEFLEVLIPLLRYYADAPNEQTPNPHENSKDIREKLLIARMGFVVSAATVFAFIITDKLWQVHKLWFFLLLVGAPIIGALFQKRTLKFLAIWEAIVIGMCLAGWIFGDLLVILSMATSLFCSFISGIVSSVRWYCQEKAEQLLTLENCKNDPEMCKLLQPYAGGCMYIAYPISSQLISDCIKIGVFVRKKPKGRKNNTAQGECFMVAENYRKQIEDISQNL